MPLGQCMRMYAAAARIYPVGRDANSPIALRAVRPRRTGVPVRSPQRLRTKVRCSRNACLIWLVRTAWRYSILNKWVMPLSEVFWLSSTWGRSPFPQIWAFGRIFFWLSFCCDDTLLELRYHEPIFWYLLQRGRCTRRLIRLRSVLMAIIFSSNFPAYRSHFETPCWVSIEQAHKLSVSRPERIVRAVYFP